MNRTVGGGCDVRVALKYLDAKLEVIRAGFVAEISNPRPLVSRLSETEFLREAAWVVLSAGMREAIIRRKFEAVSHAFYYWRSASLIRDHAEQCQVAAAVHFGNAAKLRAIATIARRVAESGFDRFKTDLRERPMESLGKLPFMGPATTRHLAKNIGFDVVKPDRHLMRIAAAAQFSSADELCNVISSIVGDPLSVVDSVLWRYATLRPDYLDAFRES
jgi:hypothetical protein